MLQYKIFVDGNTSDKFSCDNINASAGYGFLPDSRAACVFSLVRKENAKFDNDTTPTMELISAQHKLSDCIAIMFLRGAATTTNARHYYGFVNADLYQTQKSNTYNWTYGTGTAKYAEWVDVSDVYARTLVGNAPDLGKCELRCYADWDAASDTDTSKMIEAYVFVKDGEKKAATPGKVQINQFPAHLSVVAMQNKVGKATQDVRFIGWVDSLNYTEVGVKIAAAYVDGNEKISKNGTQSITTDTVYATVTGGGQTYTTSSPEIGKNGTGHLIAAAVSGLNVTDDTHIIFYLTAFGVLADGTTVYGKTTSAVLNGTALTNPNAEDGSYRIMTFNVLRANQRKDKNSTVIDYKTIDYQSCMDSISAYGADVVGFEEYCTAFSQYLNPLLVQNGYTVLGATDTVTTNSSGVVNSTKQNMAPLAYKTSRFNLLDWGEGRVDGTYLGKEPKPYPGHWITWAVLQDKASGEVFSVATTHGFHRSNVTEKDAGQLQYHVPAMIDTIYSLMNNAKAKAVKGSDFTCPVVFVGDYNMKTNSDPYNAVFSSFTSHASYKTAYGVLADARFVALQGYTVGKAGHTWKEANRNYNDADMIDHIIVTESVGVIEHKICVSATTTAASDHYPVYVDIVLSNQ